MIKSHALFSVVIAAQQVYKFGTGVRSFTKNVTSTPVILTGVHLHVPIAQPVCHTYGSPMHYRFFTFWALGVTFRPKFTKLGGGLQQAPPRHPAKFQPDRANGLRDMRY